MTNALRTLRIIWGALLASVVLYAVIGETVSHNGTAPNPAVFKVIAAICVATVLFLMVVRRFTAKLRESLPAAREDIGALARWRGSYLVTFALCEIIALYGFVLRMQGFTFSQVWPFYLGGIVLLLFFAPRRRPALLDVTGG